MTSPVGTIDGFTSHYVDALSLLRERLQTWTILAQQVGRFRRNRRVLTYRADGRLGPAAAAGSLPRVTSLPKFPFVVTDSAKPNRVVALMELGHFGTVAKGKH